MNKIKKNVVGLFIVLCLAGNAYAESYRLDTARFYKLNELTVLASRVKAKLKELPFKIEIITKKDISHSGATSLNNLLKSNTSLDIIQYPGFLSGIGMRGFAPGAPSKYVNVFVNGMPLGTGNMSNITLNGINHIEILKGPYSSLYGSDAMGGIINIVPTIHKDKLTGTASIAYGSYHTLQGTIALGGKIIGGLSFDANAFYNKQWENYKTGGNNFFTLNDTEKAILGEIPYKSKNTTSYSVRKRNTTLSSKGFNVRLGYDFNENWSVNLYNTVFNAPGFLTSGDIFELYDPGKKTMSRYETRLMLNGSIGRHLLQFNPYYVNDNYDYLSLKKGDVSTVASISKYLSYNYGFQLQDIISVGNHKITVGIDNNNKASKSTRHDEVDDKDIAPFKPNYKSNNLGFFVQSNLKFLDNRLNLSAGVRCDIYKFTLEANSLLKNKKQAEKYFTLTPNIGLKYDFYKNLSLHMSFGQGFKAPSAFQKAGEYNTYKLFKGNNNLKGEHTNNIDFGFGYSNNELGLNVDVTYFHTNHKDFIVEYIEDPDGKAGTKDEYTTYRNSDKARIRGLELMASYDFGALADYDFSLRAYMNGTILLRAEKELAGKIQDLQYVSKGIANVGLQFVTKKHWDVKINARFKGSRVEPNQIDNYTILRPGLIDKKLKKALSPLEHPNFMIFDAYVYYNINKYLTVGVNTNNILDENYTEKDGYNMQGRNFLGKIIFKL